MQYGFILPGGDVHTLIELASEAEAAGLGWCLLLDAISIESAGAMYDPWVTLAAIATHTKRVRIGAAHAIVTEADPLTGREKL